MFTGIIEAVGTVVGSAERDGVREISIEATREFLAEATPGVSIAVDGACLTPISIEGARFTVEAVGTTLSRTICGGYRTGTPVNLERALSLGGPLDGHLVQGHVDGVGHLISIRDGGDFRKLTTVIPDDVHALTLEHGSIALNGVSLTVNRLVTGSAVEVSIIPHTWTETNFQYLSVGDPLNVEGDLIGKYVGRVLRRNLDDTEPGSARSRDPEG